MLPLFDAPLLTSTPPPAPRPRRRFVATTSRKAYDELRPKLPARETFVLDGLRAYEREQHDQPTAYELIEFLKGKHPAARIDANTVRPRLTTMAKTFDGPNWTPVEQRIAKRAVVAKVAQRQCTVTKKQAWTWRVL